MDPTLSRRVGRLMMTDPVRRLDLDRPLAFVDVVSSAESFEALSVWVRDIILAERETAWAGIVRNVAGVELLSARQVTGPPRLIRETPEPRG
jgi:hypothetical protein